VRGREGTGGFFCERGGEVVHSGGGSLEFFLFDFDIAWEVQGVEERERGKGEREKRRDIV